MNRLQRRLATKNQKQQNKQEVLRQKTKIKNAILDMRQEAYIKGKEDVNELYSDVFMHYMAIGIKVMHEQYGWGVQRLTKYVNFILAEYNESDMSIKEIEDWCWRWGGFQLKTEDKSN